MGEFKKVKFEVVDRSNFLWFFRGMLIGASIILLIFLT